MTPLSRLPHVLFAMLSWCAGAIFAATWLWFLGLQLTSTQAAWLVGLFTALGLIFGLVQSFFALREGEPGGVKPGIDEKVPNKESAEI